MGIAFGAVVKSLVDNLITPIIGMIGGVDFASETFTINGSVFRYGQFINDVIYFVLVAAAVFFFVVKPVNMLMARIRKPEEVAPDAPTETRAADRDPRPLCPPPRVASWVSTPMLYGDAASPGSEGEHVSDAIIQLEHVSKRFGQKLAVDDVTVDVPRGRCFAWLGPNGCGKTTLIRMMLGLARPTGGRIHLRGCEVPQRDPQRALARRRDRRGAALLPLPERAAQSRRVGRALRRRGARAHPGGARARRAERARGRQGQDLFARHAPAPRRRARPAQRPRAARAGRADQRARPRRHGRVPHDDPRPRREGGAHRLHLVAHPRRGRRRWPTTSRSCRRAG